MKDNSEFLSPFPSTQYKPKDMPCDICGRIEFHNSLLRRFFQNIFHTPFRKLYLILLAFIIIMKELILNTIFRGY